jgi:signal peptidase II
MKRFWALSVMSAFLIIIDQLTKGAVQSSFTLGESIPVIDGFLNLTYVRNPGAAFGFLAYASDNIRKFMFLLIPTIFSFGVLYMLIKTIKGPAYMSLAYALILSGAIGNLIDRYSLRYVVDFFDFYIGDSHFPAFNVADSCITVAAFLLVYDMIIQKIEERKKSKVT